MSKISDALKKASQTDQAAAAPSSAASFGSAPAPLRRSSFSPVAIGGVALVVVGAAVWITCRAIFANHAPPPVVAPVVRKPSPPPPVVQVAPPPPVAAPPTNAAPTFPRLKLQAILFTKASPHVVINGQTLGEGDTIAEARVKQIDPESVSVEWNGQTKILRMANP